MTRKALFALVLPLALAGCMDRIDAGGDGGSVAPILSPEEALATFNLPDGFRIELVAAEPLVRDPVAVEFDAAGRLWVVEMSGYMPDIYDRGAEEPVGRIAVLEDLDGDGRMDVRTVFLDRLVLPRAVKVFEDGVLVGAPPNLYFARDTTGDLRADVTETVRTDFGDPAGNVEHNANGLLWGIDNWIHNANWGAQLRYRGDGEFDFRAVPQSGQWGISQNEYGRIYRNTNEDPVRTDLISAHYAARNPNLPSMRGLWEQLTPNVAVYPARVTPGINRGYRPQTMREDSTLAHYTAAGAPFAYTGDALPAEFRRQVFVMEPVGNLVGRFEIIEDTEDAIPSARRVDPQGTDFLTSMDERFRPVNLSDGPDGALYVVDMYRGIIQHRFFMTDYLEQIIRQRELEGPTGRGRIYRIVPTNGEVRRGSPGLDALEPAELVEFLAHPNGWHRMTAQQRIVERGDSSVAPAVRALLEGSADDRVRLHALWTLDGIGAADDASILLGLRDSSPWVRMGAVRVAEKRLIERSEEILGAVTALIDDPDARVRAQVAASLGEVRGPRRGEGLALMAARHGGDPLLPDLVVSGVRGEEFAFLERLLALPGGELREAAAPTVRAVAAAVYRSRDADAVQRLISRAVQGSRPEWQRLALLASTGGGRGGGPGGGGFGGGPGGGSGGQGGIRLETEPTALIAMSQGNGPLAAGARSVAAMLDWPGKPQPAPAANPAPPLSGDQAARFAEGERIFSTVCAACHGPQGEGIDGLGKPLAGSPWVVTRPIEVVRILLHGKEGEREMPALGGALDDDAIAAVLTYIRRSWGHQASAVNPRDVTEVRGATTGRNRPYTEDELRAAR